MAAKKMGSQAANSNGRKTKTTKKASPAKKTTTKKSAAKKPAAKKSAAKKPATKKVAAKKTGAKKAGAKKSGTKKKAAKKSKSPAKAKAAKSAKAKSANKASKKAGRSKRGRIAKKTAKAKSSGKAKAAAKAKPAAQAKKKVRTKSKPVRAAAAVKKAAAAKPVKSYPAEKKTSEIAKKPIAEKKPLKKGPPQLKVVSNISDYANFNGTSSVGLMGLKPYQPKAGEEYMSDTQLDHFKQLLLLWKQTLMKEADETITHMRDEASNALADPNDRASQEEVFSLELRARDREGKLLKKIEEALDDIEHKDYGFCKVCGIEIGIRRLEARPTASLCIDCKTLDEIKEKQQGG